MFGTRADGEPLRRADLAGGPDQLVVIADDGGGGLEDRELLPLGRRVRHVRLETEPAARRPLRLFASIALAEIAHQSGACWRGVRARSVARCEHDWREP